MVLIFGLPFIVLVINLIGCLVLGVPMVIWEKVKEYRNGEMSRRDVILWRIAFVGWGLFFALVWMVSNNSTH